VNRLIATCLLVGLPAGTWAGVPADLDAHVERVRREFRVPGLAVAIVKDGEVVLARGYGVRREGDPGRVDADTLFGIASNSKAFTCAALSQLVERHALSWDDPVIRHLPGFRMFDPWVTRQITVRDLVTHRSGLGTGAGDLMWWPSTDLSRAEIVSGIAELRPSTSFRSTYAYNNVLYVAAGQVLARVSGRPWDDAVREGILEPLGMTRTTTSASAGDPNVAMPHLEVGGEVLSIEPMVFDNVAAAAGLNSSAADLSRWVLSLLECESGRAPRPGIPCVLEASSIRKMWSAQTVRPVEVPAPLKADAPHLSAYGLGFGVVDLRGRKVVSHTGGLPGYVSRITLVPEERLGVVVLTNQEARGGYDAVTRHVLDAYLGPPDPPVDWVAAFAAVARDKEGKARAQADRDAAARLTGTSPSLPLPGYAGRYVDPWYGEGRVAAEEGHLVLDMTRTPGMVADLEHWHLDTFVARWRTTFMSDSAPAEAWVTFELDRRGRVERIRLAPVSPAIDFSFDFQDLSFTPIGSDAEAP